jgi:hypothetical protein
MEFTLTCGKYYTQITTYQRGTGSGILSQRWHITLQGSKTAKQQCGKYDITQQAVLEERYGCDIGLHQTIDGHRVQAGREPGAKVADDKKQH